MGWSFTIIEFWGAHGEKDTANAMMEFLTGMNEERDVSRTCSYKKKINLCRLVFRRKSCWKLRKKPNMSLSLAEKSWQRRFLGSRDWETRRLKR
jgi:hypothetical protein